MNNADTMNVMITVSLAFICLSGCKAKQTQTDLEIKSDIQKQLDKCVNAVATKDIGLYMDLIPEDFIIKDESGEIISREKQKEYTLRDWSIIDTTLNNQFVVDSVKTYGDIVIAYTSQKWERLMFRPDGIIKDTIITTQKHIETWKKTPRGWLNYNVQELGGKTFVNGREYRE